MKKSSMRLFCPARSGVADCQTLLIIIALGDREVMTADIMRDC